MQSKRFRYNQLFKKIEAENECIIGLPFVAEDDGLLVLVFTSTTGREVVEFEAG